MTPDHMICDCLLRRETRTIENNSSCHAEQVNSQLLREPFLIDFISIRLFGERL